MSEWICLIFKCSLFKRGKERSRTQRTLSSQWQIRSCLQMSFCEIPQTLCIKTDFFWTFFKTIENHLQKQSVEMLSTVNMVERWWRWRLCLLVLEGHWGQLWKTEGFVGVKAVRCSDIKIQSPLSEISSPLHLLQVPDVVAIPDHCTYHRLPPTEQFQFQFQQEPVPVFSTGVQVL